MKVITQIQLADTGKIMTVFYKKGDYLLRVDEYQLYFKIPALAYEILTKCHLNYPISDISKLIFQKTDLYLDADQIKQMHDHIINQINLKISKLTNQRKGMLFCWPIVPEKAVIILSKYLAVCFSLPACFLFTGIIILCLTQCNLYYQNISIVNTQVIWAYFLFLISAFFHEIGHASACQNYDICPGEIGLTVYLIFPNFYCYTNGITLLEKHKRMVIDLAGIYFQLIIASIYSALYYMIGWKPLISAISMIFICCLISMIPLLKTDGYWFIADCFNKRMENNRI